MKNNDSTSFVALVCSIALHSLLFYIIMRGLPFTNKVFDEEHVITFDMLSVSDVSNITTQKIQNLSTEKIEEAKKVLKNINETITQTPTQQVKKPIIEQESQTKDTKDSHIVAKEQEIIDIQKTDLSNKKNNKPMTISK